MAVESLLQVVAHHGNQWHLPINTECEKIATEQHRLEFAGCQGTQVRPA